MKFEVTALVVRHKDGELLQVIPIRNDDEDVRVTYPHHLVTLADLTEALIHLPNEQLGRATRDYMNGQDVSVDDYAGRLPSIGDVVVAICDRTFDWE